MSSSDCDNCPYIGHEDLALYCQTCGDSYVIQKLDNRRRRIVYLNPYHPFKSKKESRMKKVLAWLKDFWSAGGPA
jgi:hypothetical protein